MFKRPRLFAALLLLLLISQPLSAVASEPPRVVASILPLHALAAYIMQGVGEPTLLVSGGQSPHTYAMRPSDARALNEADVILWVGEELEGFLKRPIAALGDRATVITMMELLGPRLLPARDGGAWEAHSHGDHAHGHHHHHGHSHAHDHSHHHHDPHIWLDTEIAIQIGRTLANVLAQHDPVNAHSYLNNAVSLFEHIKFRLDPALEQQLEAVADQPFLVFHDAYQYLEAQFELNAIGSITVSPERLPSARRISEIRTRIAERQPRCIFSEPQFESRIVQTVTEGTHVRSGVLDPLGADLTPGPKAYFTLMKNLASALHACLSSD